MERASRVHPESLLARLGRLPDPRRRQGRRYPLPGLVGLMLLAAMHGETSVRGMWLWGCARWDALWEPLGFWTPQRPPTLTTVWNLLARLDPDALDAILSAWSSGGIQEADTAISMDGKWLRGTRRAGQPARKVVEAVSHERAVILRQREAPRGNELAAALALLQELPLREQVVTLDAGLLQRSVVKVIVAHGGAYLGVLKANQPEVAEAVTTWLQEELSPPGAVGATGSRDVDQGAWAAGASGLMGSGRR
jgi:DDE_Tnp_1-associated